MASSFSPGTGLVVVVDVVAVVDVVEVVAVVPVVVVVVVEVSVSFFLLHEVNAIVRANNVITGRIVFFIF